MFYDKHIPSVSFSEDIPPPCPCYPHFSFCSSTFPFLSHFFFSDWHTPPPPSRINVFFLDYLPSPILLPLTSVPPSPGLSFSTFDPNHCHTLVWTALDKLNPLHVFTFAFGYPSRFLSVSLVLISSLQHFFFQWSTRYLLWSTIGLCYPPPRPSFPGLNFYIKKSPTRTYMPNV